MAKNKSKGLLIGGLVVLAIAVIGAIGYFGTKGEMFRGLSFINIPDPGITIIDPYVEYRYYQRTGGGSQFEDYIYNNNQPGLVQDTVMVVEFENAVGGSYVELDRLTVNNANFKYVNCHSGVDAKINLCNVEKIPLARGGTLYSLNKYPDGSIMSMNIISTDDNNDGIYIPNDKSLTRLYPGEKRVYAIVNDTTWYASIGRQHSSGNAVVIRTQTDFKNANGEEVELVFDSQYSYPPADMLIQFH